VLRGDSDGESTFGLYLARHYHTMLDHLFLQSCPSFGFAVVLEDDLELAPDLVKYFTTMARVMSTDDSIYCVSAHNDNAFFSTSFDDSKTTALDMSDFPFRRGTF